MKVRILMIICLSLSLAAVGCEKKGGEKSGDEPTAEEPADKEKADEEKGDEKAAADEEAKEDSEEKLEKVEVAAAGTKFDPAVKPEQLPANAWFCDMGTAHWAGMEKPEDGKCPECGMKVKQYNPEKMAAQKEKAVEADEHGHAHDGDEHGHAHDGDDHHGDEEGHGHDEEGHGHGH